MGRERDERSKWDEVEEARSEARAARGKANEVAEDHVLLAVIS